MAITITRTAWIDDDGSGTTGTVINNAVKTDLYNQIDGALAKAAQLSGGNAFTGNQAISGTVTLIGGGLTYDPVGGPIAATYSVAANSQALSIVQTHPGGGGAGAGNALIRIDNRGSNDTLSVENNGVRLFAVGAAGDVVIAGQVFINTPTSVAPAHVQILANPQAEWGLALKATIDVAGGGFLGFVNAAGAAQGLISATNSTTTNYGTSSDARLKRAAGRAADLTRLRLLEVWDFDWLVDGRRDRGVFAQAVQGYPEAIARGTDERTPEGELVKPWMTDYSKFVPDLVVGWQQHEAAIAALVAEIIALKKGLSQ